MNNIIGGSTVALEVAAEAFVHSQAANNITYTEVRYDPVRAATSSYAPNESLTEEEAVRSVQRGLVQGMRAYAGRVHVHQLLCAMRGKPASACLAVAELAARTRSAAAGGVVGIDLAGDEWASNNSEYIACFRHAKEVLRLNTTVHVGETLPWPLGSKALKERVRADVRSALVEMRVDRIGHGYAAASDPALLAHIAERRVHVEACPTTAKGEGSEGALRTYREATPRLSFSISRDDPCLGCGSVRSFATDEQLTRSALGFTDEDIERARRQARAHAFGSGA